ncbi:MAG: pullulanase-type alpha-1,6-glucosidase [Anaerolineae bacterium]|nr:pullulanase-type alpha-1,6-glucosidase [Candidatus Roseilinea sp.]MDW8451716.1 pullulanase-type alpha-1,6-glucosidase [Anaerolineae bacterium]
MKKLLPLLLSLAIGVAQQPAMPTAAQTKQPRTVTIPGTIQSKLGCPGDWQPGCSKTFLTLDPVSGLWVGEFALPAGEYEYKVAIDGSWDENYGGKADRNGPNVPLKLAQPAKVRFYYDHKTHLVVDSVNGMLPVVVGNFQRALGCARDDDPTCLAGFMLDPEFDGTYGLITRKLPPGRYEVRVAIDGRPGELYGDAQGKPVRFVVRAAGEEVFFGFDPAAKQLTVSTEGAPKGNISRQRAHWVSRDIILWDVPFAASNAYLLHSSADAGLRLTPRGITGATQTITLTRSTATDPRIFERFPHLVGLTALRIAPDDLPKVAEMLRGQIAIEARDANGRMIDSSGLQIPGVLDDLYAERARAVTLGPSFKDGRPTLAVWAPTARSVKLHLFDDATGDAKQTLPMTLDPASGVWTITGEPTWKNRFYLYEVEVFAPSAGRIEKNLVTDPYSVSLSTNSKRSQIVDLNDPALQPAGWGSLKKPPLDAPEDAVIYELHVRDFSARDSTVPERLRGTFAAFTLADSNGMRHLRALAEAGLTHIHLLPAFDCATINEDKSQWKQVDFAALAKLPPDSEQQQAAVTAIADADPFNWCYDPFHFNVPEGSYSTDPNGPQRILEFRQMVQALNAAGLRVVMDVVFNHTSQSGQSEKSVLDKVVPGYYHRLNRDGAVERSTCCENTASEHAMMEKLMLDSVRLWATAYKVDGFRFDLMGHHMLRNMQAVRAMLDALTPARDGVDGKAIIAYGEGWDFGEVANNRRGVNASQLNLAGTGIGSFNDRLRDAARGGNPFDDRRLQGFITGLGTAPNNAPGLPQGDLATQRSKLISQARWIRLGLAGNLRDYELVEGNRKTRGDAVIYNGKLAGYTADPQENVIYVSAHDNETLFDKIQWAAPISATMAERVRMNNLGIALVMLGQGIPFFHAGDDLLRSKSLDRDSYNSGDWFNWLDFTYQANNWGVGLPPAGPNRERWSLMRPLLANPTLRASPADIAFARDYFRDMLRIRRSSPLFRLRTADEIKARVAFYNAGLDQIPGLIVMEISDRVGEELDAQFARIVVLFNAAPEEVVFTEPALRGLKLTLHPVQAAGSDPLVKRARYDAASGTFTIPGRTAVVFVE